MIKYTVNYKNFNGEVKSKDLYFDLRKRELFLWETQVPDGMHSVLQKALDTNDSGAIARILDDLMLRGYGERSDDGENFLKSDDIRKRFEQSAAYDQLFMDLITDEKKAADFFNGMVPADMIDQITKENSNEA